MLAVALRAQEPVGHPLVGPRGFVRCERLGIRRAWRQSRQVKKDPPEPRASVGLGRGGKPLLFQSGQDKLVQSAAGPVGLCGAGRGRVGDGLERPVVPFILQLCKVQSVGPDGSLLDPTGQQGSLFRCEAFALWRHEQIWLLPLHKTQQRTFRRLPRADVRRVVLPALECGGLDVEAQPALLFFGAVAGVAPLLEDGPDLQGEVHRRGVSKRAAEARKKELKKRAWFHSKGVFHEGPAFAGKVAL